MQTLKLSTKGQFVIPNEIRKGHHLVVGTEFVISFVGDEIRLTPLPMFPVATVEDTAGAPWSTPARHCARHPGSQRSLSADLLSVYRA